MRGYSAIEQAVLDELLNIFSDELDSDRVAAGNLDSVLENLLKEPEGLYGLWTEFGGGSMETRKPFKTLVWTWTIQAVFVIRKTDDIETNMRSIVDKLATLFADDHTLGNVSPYVRLVGIGDAAIITINDVPFYWVPFNVEAVDWDTTRRG